MALLSMFSLCDIQGFGVLLLILEIRIPCFRRLDLSELDVSPPDDALPTPRGSHVALACVQPRTCSLGY